MPSVSTTINIVITAGVFIWLLWYIVHPVLKSFKPVRIYKRFDTLQKAGSYFKANGCTYIITKCMRKDTNGKYIYELKQFKTPFKNGNKKT